MDQNGWHVYVEVSLSLIQSHIPSFGIGMKNWFKTNFYNCGDDTLYPHYLRGNDIRSDMSDLHLSMDFGKCIYIKMLKTYYSNRRINGGYKLKIINTESYDKMSRMAANILSAQVILKSKSVLGLATGSTPVGMYKQLVEWSRKGDVDFSDVTTFNLDEYVGLPAEDSNSYRAFMQNVFFNHINIHSDNVHIPNGMTKNATEECTAYERQITKAGGIDIQVLGIGHNGHIGFNEPGACFMRDTHLVKLSESTVEANARFFGGEKTVPGYAIAMGMGTIMRAKKIILLCSGQEKAQILRKAVYGDIDPVIPASVLQLHSDVTVIADCTAMSAIE